VLVRCRLLLENAARTEQREGAPGHGDGELLHLGVGGPRQRVQAQLRLVHLLEDGLGDEERDAGHRRIPHRTSRWRTRILDIGRDFPGIEIPAASLDEELGL
jgi:hypothetical protein